MKKEYVVIGLLFVITWSAVAWVKFSEKKIAYIRSSELVNQYLGMKEARKIFEIKANGWQSNIDSMAFKLDMEIKEYERNYKSMDSKSRAIFQESLSRQRNDLENYTEVIREKIKEEDSKMTQAVLDRINTSVEEYAKAEGYSVVMGTTTSGNILYGEEPVDITMAVLEKINQEYKK